MGKGRNILIFIHKLHALAHRNLADIQLCDLTLAGFYQFLPPFLEAGGRIGGFLQVNRQADPLAENLFRKGFRFFGFITVHMLAEIFKIAAVIKNQKASFAGVLAVYLIYAGQSRT